jgi:halocin C8-like bacteriocin domain-containing protein
MADDDRHIERRTVLRNLGATAGAASIAGLGRVSSAAPARDLDIQVTNAELASDEKARRDARIARNDGHVASLQTTLRSEIGAQGMEGATVIEVATNDDRINDKKPTVVIRPTIVEEGDNAAQRQYTPHWFWEPSRKVALQFTIVADVQHGKRRKPATTQGYVIEEIPTGIFGTSSKSGDSYSVSTYGVDYEANATHVTTQSFVSRGGITTMGIGCDICEIVVEFFCSFVERIDEEDCMEACTYLIGDNEWSEVICEASCSIVVGIIDEMGCGVVSEEVCSFFGVC